MCTLSAFISNADLLNIYVERTFYELISLNILFIWFVF